MKSYSDPLAPSESTQSTQPHIALVQPTQTLRNDFPLVHRVNTPDALWNLQNARHPEIAPLFSGGEHTEYGFFFGRRGRQQAVLRRSRLLDNRTPAVAVLRLQPVAFWHRAATRRSFQALAELTLLRSVVVSFLVASFFFLSFLRAICSRPKTERALTVFCRGLQK